LCTLYTPLIFRMSKYCPSFNKCPSPPEEETQIYKYTKHETEIMISYFKIKLLESTVKVSCNKYGL
jgi:hypothetical protein